MTVDTIFCEIEKRLDFLGKKREEVQIDISTAKCYNNDKEFDKLLTIRNKIDREREILKDMRRAYNGRF